MADYENKCNNNFIFHPYIFLCSWTTKNKDIGMGYGTLVVLVIHNMSSLYPSSFCRNSFKLNVQTVYYCTKSSCHVKTLYYKYYVKGTCRTNVNVYSNELFCCVQVLEITLSPVVSLVSLSSNPVSLLVRI